MNTLYQPGILEPLPAVARLFFFFQFAGQGTGAPLIGDALGPGFRIGL